MEDDETRQEITKIINQNKIDDLRRFIAKRGCLNMSNQYLNYLFYLLQSIGVFSTSLGTYQNEYLVWSGVGCNSIASFVYIVINSNSKINNTLFSNIKSIKNGTYIDEAGLDFDKKSLNNSSGGIATGGTTPIASAKKVISDV